MSENEWLVLALAVGCLIGWLAATPARRAVRGRGVAGVDLIAALKSGERRRP